MLQVMPMKSSYLGKSATHGLALGTLWVAKSEMTPAGSLIENAFRRRHRRRGIGGRSPHAGARRRQSAPGRVGRGLETPPMRLSAARPERHRSGAASPRVHAAQPDRSRFVMAGAALPWSGEIRKVFANAAPP